MILRINVLLFYLLERQTEVFHEKQVDSRFHVELSVLNFGVLATAVNVTRIYNRQEQLCSCGQIL